MKKNKKYDGYQRKLHLMVYKFLIEKTSNANKATGINTGIVSENKQSTKELQKPIIKKIEKRKSDSSFIDNIWDADLADMQL